MVVAVLCCGHTSVHLKLGISLRNHEERRTYGDFERKPQAVRRKTESGSWLCRPTHFLQGEPGEFTVCKIYQHEESYSNDFYNWFELSTVQFIRSENLVKSCYENRNVTSNMSTIWMKNSSAIPVCSFTKT